MADSDVRVLALGGNRFSFHRFEKMGPVLERFLGEAGVAAEPTTDRDALLDVGEYDALVDYTTDSTLTDAQRDALLSFVDGGGGYVGLHCASDLTTTEGEGRDEPFPKLRELVGGHFVGHPEQGALDVRVVDHHHPTTAGLDDLALWDEPYRVEIADDVRVLARMDHPGMGDMPAAWVREHGDGRVFYCSLGHGLPAFTDPGFQTFVARGTRWAADG
jgi:type 1 glutamine amidotransferase